MGPRNAEERELCERADHTDWLYLTALIGANVGAIFLEGYTWDVDVPNHTHSPWTLRLLGPATIGLAWGGLTGGGYLAFPKCSINWIRNAPVEGDVRSNVALAIGLAMLAGATAPIILGTVDQYSGHPAPDALSERVGRLVLAGGMGIVGSFIPYVLPPRTYRAAKELEKLRLSVESTGATLGVRFSF